MNHSAKRCISLLLSLLMVAGPGISRGESEADLIIEVDPGRVSPVNGGVFEGWGTSLCWWANRIGYSDILSQKAADDLQMDEGSGMLLC
ncbi:MAG: hypothetical protein IJ153_10255 [Clostridia bacterium]|nr:hypothetical protein [Clostridia bacterium]